MQRPMISRAARIAASVMLFVSPVALAQTGDLVPSRAAAPAAMQAESPQLIGTITYRLADGHGDWPIGRRDAIERAMREAVALYNTHAQLSHDLVVHYNPAVPTAHASANGHITFGGAISARVALHEISHTMGVGTTPEWRANIEGGKWVGRQASDLLARFDDNTEARLSADRQHFWPYGLNYDREDGPEQRVRHIKIVEALRADMGFAPDASSATEDSVETAGQPDADPSDQPSMTAVEEPPALPVVEPVPTARLVEPGPDVMPASIGSQEDTNKAHLEFSRLGAGITHLALPDAYQSVKHESHIDLQSIVEREGLPTAIPFAALAVTINGQVIDVASRPVWRETAPGVFECLIDDADGSPLLKIIRAFGLKPQGLYGFELTNTFENLSSRAITVSLSQTGPIDLPKPENTYGGDRRRVRFGYLLSADKQSSDTTVTVDEDLESRTTLLGKKIASGNGKVYPATHAVWPNTKSQEVGHRLSWLAMTDRYFAVAVYPMFDPGSVSSPEDKLLSGIASVDRLLLNPTAAAADTIVVLRLNGEDVSLAAGESKADVFGVYAGPMSRPSIRQDAVLASLRLPEMVVYSMGGMCDPCTFQWLTGGLMSVLRLFHSFTGDWAIAIMLLVVLVRGCLHPVTRWSQIRMQRFGVQMQAMGPKQTQLKEKYKDDPKKLQQEMGKLWKEEGINPAGMLGCLPMFLQTPVWMALYATLFFAIELRQQPAFYGVFQTISGGSWEFLSDLSQPDHAIPLPAAMHFSFPLWGAVASINILPLLLGVVFFAHQKFLTPPTSATMTPEQEQQQKIIKVMMVVMFPIMMYAAPSGLALYFITNSVMGIIEHKWIRAHMDKHGMLDPEKIRAERQTKGPGFMSRLNEAAERQKQMQAQKNGGRSPAKSKRKKK
ncbi:MAG: membrane protein insertase YidC [Phycisphaerales bacterium]